MKRIENNQVLMSQTEFEQRSWFSFWCGFVAGVMIAIAIWALTRLNNVSE